MRKLIEVIAEQPNGKQITAVYTIEGQIARFLLLPLRNSYLVFRLLIKFSVFLSSRIICFPEEVSLSNKNKGWNQKRWDFYIKLYRYTKKL